MSLCARRPLQTPTARVAIWLPGRFCRSGPSTHRALDSILPQGVHRIHLAGPAGRQETMLDIYEHLGVRSSARDSGSTDAVAAVRRGIPAVAIGRGRGGEQHTLSEWAEARSALYATRAVLLVAVCMAELAPM